MKSEIETFLWMFQVQVELSRGPAYRYIGRGHNESNQV